MPRAVTGYRLKRYFLQHAEISPKHKNVMDWSLRGSMPSMYVVTKDLLAFKKVCISRDRFLSSETPSTTSFKRTRLNNFMIDIEAMSLAPNAAIVALGAVQMDLKNLVLGDGFYVTVDLKSSAAHGGHIDPDTVLWWLRQSNAARMEFANTTVTLPDALTMFSKWLNKVTPEGTTPRIWGNGASYDNVVVAEAYKACRLECPWSYRGNRCYRTMKEEFPHIQPEEFPALVEHNAFHDAQYQAEHLLRIYEHIRSSTTV